MSDTVPVEGFVWADIERRTFVAESRSGGAYHLIHPADAEDRRVQDGLTTAGMLVCDGCRGGRYRANCHAVASAEAVLRAAGQADFIGGAGDAGERGFSIGAESLNGFGGAQ